MIPATFTAKEITDKLAEVWGTLFASMNHFCTVHSSCARLSIITTNISSPAIFHVLATGETGFPWLTIQQPRIAG